MKFKTKVHDKEVILSLVKAKKPSFKVCFGRTWDETSLIIDGEKTPVFVDSSWGKYMYFKYKEQWYKIKLFTEEYNIDLFYLPNTLKLEL
jgi:hypothetical protein